MHSTSFVSFIHLRRDNNSYNFLQLNWFQLQVRDNGLDIQTRERTIPGGGVLDYLKANRRFGKIFYRQTSNVTLLQRARDQLQELFPSSGNFTPTTLFIATWDRVEELRGREFEVYKYTITVC